MFIRLLWGGADPPDAGGAFVLTVTASTRRPVQLRFAADALPTAADLVATLDAAIPADLYHDDIHGLPEWRRDMTYRLGEQIRAELVDGTPSARGLRRRRRPPRTRPRRRRSTVARHAPSPAQASACAPTCASRARSA